MAFVLVYRIRLRRPIIAVAVAAVAVATGMAASALISSGLAQSDAAKPAEMAKEPLTSSAKIDDAPGATADRKESETGRAEAADGSSASPSGPTGHAMEDRKRALIILMFQNGTSRPFGSFK